MDNNLQARLTDEAGRLSRLCMLLQKIYGGRERRAYELSGSEQGGD